LQFANNVDQEHKKRSLYRKRGEKNFRKYEHYTCSTTILSPVDTTARDVFLIKTKLRSFQERNYYDSKDGGRQIDKKKQKDINQTKYCDKAVEDEKIKKKIKVTAAATAGQRCLCFDRFRCAQSDRPPCSGLQRQQLGMEETGRTGIQPAPLMLVLCPDPCDTVLLL
jgi:hypothetical protein